MLDNDDEQDSYSIALEAVAKEGSAILNPPEGKDIEFHFLSSQPSVGHDFLFSFSHEYIQHYNF